MQYSDVSNYLTHFYICSFIFSASCCRTFVHLSKTLNSPELNELALTLTLIDEVNNRLYSSELNATQIVGCKNEQVFVQITMTFVKLCLSSFLVFNY